MLLDYIDFQISVLTRRTKFLLKRDADRDHIVVGLLTAHDNIDEVIHIIRSSKTDEESAAKLNATALVSPTRANRRHPFDDLTQTPRPRARQTQAEHAELTKNIAEYNRLLSEPQTTSSSS
jgi:DNA gyrase subunit A